MQNINKNIFKRDVFDIIQASDKQYKSFSKEIQNLLKFVEMGALNKIYDTEK